jgi:hypothetical protein
MTSATAQWATDRTTPLSIVKPRRPSSLALIAGAGRALWAGARGRAADAVDVAGLALLTVGAAHLPGTWGEVGVWAVGGLSLLITSAKLST